MLDVRRMRYFVAVAEELNFRRAAERLRMSQPPLSQQIAALEHELRTALFERTRQRVVLTAAGRVLLERARLVLAEVERTRQELRAVVSGQAGDLRIGFTASAGLMPFLHRALESFRTDHPHVRVTMSELPSLAQLEWLHKRELDLGIVRKPPLRQGSGIRLDRLHQDRLVVAVHRDNPLARPGSIRIIELRDEPFIAYPRESGISLFQTIYAMATKAGFYPNVVHEARDSATIVGLVASGQGIAIVPSSLRCIQLDAVRFLDIRDSAAHSGLFLAQLTDVDTLQLQAARTHLDRHAAADARAAERKPR